MTNVIRIFICPAGPDIFKKSLISVDKRSFSKKSFFSQLQDNSVINYQNFPNSPFIQISILQ
ncbi:hypothetical protein DW888_18905 [Bacteroides nordii]|uniref:Uncharacterized protein n=1 Tax=Bacteroides nordii TaxID=291645 RepID=A0A413V9Z3_9BACE|nr:hypothetical protein DW888_18905 [Bacteroides nordii]